MIRVYRIFLAKIRKFFRKVFPEKSRKNPELLKKVLRMILGGAICFKHLEQMRAGELEELKLYRLNDNEKIEAYENFCENLRNELSELINDLAIKGIKTGSVQSEGLNPKKFYYIIETPENLSRARTFLGF